MTKQVVFSFLIVLAVIIAGIFLFKIPATLAPTQEVDSFDECVAMGYPVMESYPRQCRDGEGNLFVEEIEPAIPPIIPGDNLPEPEPETPESPEESDPLGVCQIGGCSGEICSEHGGVSTCEYREEYACYQSAVCERQADGECGWTKTPELQACLSASR